MPLATVKVYHAAAIVTPALTFETKPYVKKASAIRLSESLSNFHRVTRACTAPAATGSSLTLALDNGVRRKTGPPARDCEAARDGVRGEPRAWSAADECSAARTTASNFLILSTIAISSRWLWPRVKPRRAVKNRQGRGPAHGVAVPHASWAAAAPPARRAGEGRRGRAGAHASCAGRRGGCGDAGRGAADGGRGRGGSAGAGGEAGGEAPAPAARCPMRATGARRGARGGADWPRADPHAILKTLAFSRAQPAIADLLAEHANAIAALRAAIADVPAFAAGADAVVKYDDIFLPASSSRTAPARRRPRRRCAAGNGAPRTRRCSRARPTGCHPAWARSTNYPRRAVDVRVAGGRARQIIRAGKSTRGWMDSFTADHVVETMNYQGAGLPPRGRGDAADGSAGEDGDGDRHARAASPTTTTASSRRSGASSRALLPAAAPDDGRDQRAVVHEPAVADRQGHHAGEDRQVPHLRRARR